jgi:hypothetical protein
MRTNRRHPRIRDTGDLRVTLRLTGRSPQDGDVLNLSEGGMLVGCAGLAVGERAGFDLAGPGFQYAGMVLVAHHTDATTGLRFLSWHGQAQRPVCSLIDRRSDCPDTHPLVDLRDHYIGLLLGPGQQEAADRPPMELQGLWHFLGGDPPEDGAGHRA